MLSALTSLTGGGGLTGGSSGPLQGGDSQASGAGSDTGNIENGGITINQGFKFDSGNPLHWAGVAVVGLVVLKVLKK